MAFLMGKQSAPGITSLLVYYNNIAVIVYILIHYLENKQNNI